MIGVITERGGGKPIHSARKRSRVKHLFTLKILLGGRGEHPLVTFTRP